jgi:hypothetical protein
MENTIVDFDGISGKSSELCSSDIYLLELHLYDSGLFDLQSSAHLA